jgi:hydrogenase-4 component E
MITLATFTMLAGAVYALALLMNLVSKNTTLVGLYALQSAIVAVTLIALSNAEGAQGLFFAGILTLIVKTIAAPVFLTHLIARYGARFAAKPYLSVPLSVCALAVIVAASYSFVFTEIQDFAGSTTIPLLVASIFSVLFLMVNRRGALSQIAGVLALENVVVLFAALIGVEHSLALELVITFDIAVWIAIASAFLTMMYRQFGEIEDAAVHMTHLTEE